MTDRGEENAGPTEGDAKARVDSDVNFWRLVGRALALKCPACGEGEVIRDWRSTHDRCGHCGQDFQIESGFYLGSIYFNYGLTAALVMAVSAPLILYWRVSLWVLGPIAIVFCVLFALWFFRYARSLWLAFDYFYCRESRLRGHAQQATGASARLIVDRQQAELAEGEVLHAFRCPFCHQRFEFRDAAKGQWEECPYCQGKVLLQPVSTSKVTL